MSAESAMSSYTASLSEKTASAVSLGENPLRARDRDRAARAARSSPARLVGTGHRADDQAVQVGELDAQPRLADIRPRTVAEDDLAPAIEQLRLVRSQKVGHAALTAVYVHRAQSNTRLYHLR